MSSGVQSIEPRVELLCKILGLRSEAFYMAGWTVGSLPAGLSCSEGLQCVPWLIRNPSKPSFLVDSDNFTSSIVEEAREKLTTVCGEVDLSIRVSGW